MKNHRILRTCAYLKVAEPYDIQIDETGNNIITMCQFIGEISDTKGGGLESLLNHMNEHFFSKDDPAVNIHIYRITKKQYNEEIHNIHNVDKSKPFNTKGNTCLTAQYFNQTQNINNSIINNKTKNNVTNNIEDYPYKTYTSNNYKSQTAYVEHKIYKIYDNRVFNNTNNTYKHVNQYSTDVFNNYTTNKSHNVNNTNCNFINDVVMNKHDTINTHDAYNVTIINKRINVNGNKSLCKEHRAYT